MLFTEKAILCSHLANLWSNFCTVKAHILCLLQKSCQVISQAVRPMMGYGAANCSGQYYLKTATRPPYCNNN